MRCTILACDPGSSNYGYSVLQCDLERQKMPAIKVLQFGCLHNTLRDLKAKPAKQLDVYLGSLNALAVRYKITHVIAERYMSRRMGGVTIELVNIMLGALITNFASVETKVLPASQWKNELKRRGVDLEDVYAAYKGVRITPHAIDASMIGCYAAYILSGLKPYGDEFKPEGIIDAALIHKDIGVRPKAASKKKRNRK